MEDLHSKFQNDLDLIAWKDVARDFAFKRLCYVEPQIDIVEVAVAMAQDDAPRISQWMQQGLFRLADDRDANRLSHNQGLKLQVLVVSPFVIVSPEVHGVS